MTSKARRPAQTKKDRGRTASATTAGSTSARKKPGAASSAAKNGGSSSAKAKPGRPTTYSAALADAFCLLIAQGFTVREACEPEEAPAKSTIFVWLYKHPEFADQYARALKARTAAMAEEIIEIADNAQPFMGKVDKEKLQVDARKWHMSKMLPKVYGDAHTIKGDPENPLQVAPAAIVVPKKDVSTAGSAVAAEPPPG